MTTAEYAIGQEITRAPNDPTRWLVVRIVERDTALIVVDNGDTFITSESYVMLKSEKGEIDFVTLMHDDCSFGFDATKITPLPSYWRKYNGKST